MPRGIYPRPSPETRFWERVNKNGPVPSVRPDLGPCWLWIAGCNNHGYGTIRANGKDRGAHRLAYEIVIGAVPDNLDLDHLCRVPICVRPSHLEPVTHRENILRGVGATAINARKTHCKNGHPFDEANTILKPYPGGIGRKCRICKRNWERQYFRTHRAKLKRAKL